MNDHSDTIGTLSDLIDTCKDGEYGFEACARHATSVQLKTLFENRAAECRTAASQLQAHVADLGGSPDTGGSAGGALHRGWVAVKSTLSTYDDLAVLEECERGEDVALDSYRDALKQQMPAPIRNLVEQQYQGVKRNHDAIRTLRDSMKAS